jgi:hypothetical protein
MIVKDKAVRLFSAFIVFRLKDLQIGLPWGNAFDDLSQVLIQKLSVG